MPQVVAQLWLLTAYLVDGFAVAGTVFGSRLAARGDPAAHRRAFPSHLCVINSGRQLHCHMRCHTASSLSASIFRLALLTCFISRYWGCRAHGGHFQ